MAAVVTHWGCIGAAVLMGLEPDYVVPTTSIVSGLIALAGIAGIMIGSRQPNAEERMRAGPRMVSQWRPLVFGLGFGSDLGGVILYTTTQPRAGLLAIILGTIIVGFELAALCGASMLGDKSD